MKNLTVKAGAKIGAVMGTLVWLVAGILPGFHFGGYGAIILYTKLMGVTSADPTLLLRVFAICGMMVGIMAAGTVCIVLGGLAGTAIGYVVSPKQSVEVAQEAK